MSSSKTKICADWHKEPFKNPITGRSIKYGGPTYKKLEKLCGSLPPSSRRRSPSTLPLSRRRRSPSPPPRVEIYCGNNARDEGLRNRTKVLGTRYQCLKKGIGRGLKEPILTYNEDYEPIENSNIFCGNGDILPQNKNRFGTRDECLRKGFAIGQKQKFERDGGIQRRPVISEDSGWYKIYLPSHTGIVDFNIQR